MAERDETQDWLDALAGKQSPNAEPSLVRKTAVLRHAIQRHDSDLMGKDYNVEAELQRLNDRLSNEGLFETARTSESFSKRWVAFVGAILSAFIFGLVAMRFAMMPSLEGVKSDGTVLPAEGRKRFVQIVPLYVTDPTETMKATVEAASRLEMNLSVKAVDGGYDIVLEGLIPNAVAQDALKQILGLSGSAGGNLQFQIRQKPKN